LPISNLWPPLWGGHTRKSGKCPFSGPSTGILCTVLYMSDTLAITEARARFGQIVRRASHSRERITITDHGQPAAVIISAEELADLEEALAIAQYDLRQATGTAEPGIPHEEVRKMLGLDRKRSA
jgi:prevent-host-death family protein